jgi:hypothetical protein
MAWSVNKDDTIIWKSGDKLVAGIWRKTKDDIDGVIAVIYGPEPDVWSESKFFPGQGQVKEAKAWVTERLRDKLYRL